jgi:hypothetical protein
MLPVPKHVLLSSTERLHFELGDSQAPSPVSGLVLGAVSCGRRNQEGMVSMGGTYWRCDETCLNADTGHESGLQLMKTPGPPRRF